MSVDSLLRRGLAVFGVIALVSAFVFVVQPGAAAGLPFGIASVIGVGVVLLVLGLYMGRLRYQSTTRDAETPTPESPPPANVPGDGFDRKLHQMVERGRGAIEYREQIETRVRNLTIQSIQYRDDCSEAEAVRQIENGEWTDNMVAAAFVTGRILSDDASFLDRVLGEERDEFTEALDETVTALGDLTQLTPDEAAVDEAAVDVDEAPAGLLDRIRSRLAGDDGDRETVSLLAEWNPPWVQEAGDGPRDSFQLLDEHATNHWQGVSMFGLIAAGLGVFVQQPALLLSGSIGVGYAAYAHRSSSPQLHALEVERSVSDESPDPGDEVTVEISVTNAGAALLSDLRLIDMVPDTWVVTDGAPRKGTALRPGKTVTFEYTAVAQRGTFDWPLYVVARDSSASTEVEGYVTPSVTVTCRPTLRTVTEAPVRSQTSQYSGSVNTAVGGPGLEFFSVRDYRPGDPMNRVHWGRLARTGELATVNYRQEQAATIVLLFDSRQSAYASPAPGIPHAVDRSVTAAGEAFASLQDRGDLVGLAAFDTVPCWLGPGAGTEQVERARILLTEHPAIASTPPELDNRDSAYVDPMTHVRRQLPTDAQLFMFSPIADDYAYEVARQLDSLGHLVTIISPDPTADRSIGQRFARIERKVRINSLREHGLRVIDWQPNNELALEFERAETRWSA